MPRPARRGTCPPAVPAAGTTTRSPAAAQGDDMDLTLIAFDSPTEVRTFEKGRFELYEVGPMTLGRATYEPGWRYTEHVGEAYCQVEHVGLVLSGQAAVKMQDGSEKVMRAGEFFTCRPATTAGSSATSPTSRCTSWA